MFCCRAHPFLSDFPLLLFLFYFPTYLLAFSFFFFFRPFYVVHDPDHLILLIWHLYCLHYILVTFLFDIVLGTCTTSFIDNPLDLKRLSLSALLCWRREYSPLKISWTKKEMVQIPSRKVAGISNEMYFPITLTSKIIR